tara:strand:+ start:1312 stop:1455 length:144 start_codon:yes stop_codon:yes gene_type:complete
MLDTQFTPIKGLMLGFEYVDTYDEYLNEGSYLVIDFFVVRITIFYYD